MSWLSKALKRSKKKRTGIFSWGDSNYANFLDPSGTLDKQLDKLADGPSETGSVSATDVAGLIPSGYNNQMIIYAVGALIAYKIFIK